MKHCLDTLGLLPFILDILIGVWLSRKRLIVVLLGPSRQRLDYNLRVTLYPQYFIDKLSYLPFNAGIKSLWQRCLMTFFTGDFAT
jgi:hypothetical protein